MTPSTGGRRRFELVISWAHAKAIPFTTSLALATLALSSAYLAFDPSTGWGYLPAEEIWRGRVWPLWTTVLRIARIRRDVSRRSAAKASISADFMPSMS